LVLLHPALAAKSGTHNDRFEMLAIASHFDEFARQIVLNVTFDVFGLNHKGV
jgi:hypothetical protein